MKVHATNITYKLSPAELAKAIMDEATNKLPSELYFEIRLGDSDEFVEDPEAWVYYKIYQATDLEPADFEFKVEED